jgi:catechol 2,3-dioxygenase-like lactoylglutathione lyase family enzyme
MSSADLARRFLHVNLNTVDIDAAQVFFADCLGLKLQMRTDPEVLNDGEILGLSGKVRSETRFFYDSRGARASCAIEVIDWVDPATLARDQSDTSTGLAALGFVVADRTRVIETMSDNRFDILSTDTDGLITGGPAAMVLGPDGVVIEIGDLPGAATGTVHFAGARVACTDLQASMRFYTAIGFDQIGSRHNDRMCHVGLTEDADSIRLCLTQDTAAATAPAHKVPNQQGLYRCALRVENVQRAIAAVADGIAVRGPIWCPLPGTPIDGLHIAFMTDPDGVVIEYVERPLSHFSGPTNGRTSR